MGTYHPLRENAPNTALGKRESPTRYDTFGDNVCCKVPREGVHMHGHKRTITHAKEPNVTSKRRRIERHTNQREALDAMRKTHCVTAEMPFGYKVYVSGRLAGHMILLNGICYWRDYIPSSKKFGSPEPTQFKCDPSQIGRKALADFLCVGDATKIKKWPLR